MTSLALKETSVADRIMAGTFVGFVDGLPAETYHAAPYYSHSFLGYAAQSLAEGKAYYDGLIPSPETTARRRGTLVHARATERERFDLTYTCGPRLEDFPGALDTAEQIAARLKELGLKVSGRKADLIERLKAAEPNTLFWDEILECELRGKTLVAPEEYEIICRASDALHANPKIGPILKAGVAERSFFWIDRELDIPRKARLDSFVADPAVILDLKTFDDLSDNALERQMRRMHYDWQEINYTAAVEAVLDVKVQAFANAFVQLSEPFLTRRVFVNQEGRERARGEVKFHWTRVAHAHRTGQWPGYENESEELSLYPF